MPLRRHVCVAAVAATGSAAAVTLAHNLDAATPSVDTTSEAPLDVPEPSTASNTANSTSWASALVLPLALLAAASIFRDWITQPRSDCSVPATNAADDAATETADSEEPTASTATVRGGARPTPRRTPNRRAAAATPLAQSVASTYGSHTAFAIEADPQADPSEGKFIVTPVRRSKRSSAAAESAMLLISPQQSLRIGR